MIQLTRILVAEWHAKRMQREAARQDWDAVSRRVEKFRAAMERYSKGMR